MIRQSSIPSCPRTSEDCALAPQRLAAVCHELGQHLHAFGLHASTLNQTLIPEEAHEPLAQMTRSVQALELTIKTLHELVNLAIRPHTPVLRPVPVTQLFDQLERYFLPSGIIISFRNYRPQVMSDPGILFRLLRCALRSAARYSGMQNCNLAATTHKERVVFSIVAPPKATPDHRKRTADDLDLEIAQILSHQMHHGFYNSFNADGSIRITIAVPRANR